MDRPDEMEYTDAIPIAILFSISGGLHTKRPLLTILQARLVIRITKVPLGVGWVIISKLNNISSVTSRPIISSASISAIASSVADQIIGIQTASSSVILVVICI